MCSQEMEDANGKGKEPNIVPTMSQQIGASSKTLNCAFIAQLYIYIIYIHKLSDVSLKMTP